MTKCLGGQVSELFANWPEGELAALLYAHLWQKQKKMNTYLNFLPIALGVVGGVEKISCGWKSK